MPYIASQDRRKGLWEGLYRPNTAAEVNFLISKYYLILRETGETDIILFEDWVQGTIEDYIKDAGLSYQTLNDLVGVLGCVQGEMLRRHNYKHLFNGVLKNRLSALFTEVINIYEKKKLEDNGDIV